MIRVTKYSALWLPVLELNAFGTLGISQFLKERGI